MQLGPFEDNSNSNLRRKTGFSKRKFDRAKAELVHKSYLETQQVYGNVYVLYIGKRRDLRYKEESKKSNNRHEQQQLKETKQSLESSKTEPSK